MARRIHNIDPTEQALAEMQLRNEISRSPFMNLPEDLMTLTQTGESTARDLMERADFPKIHRVRRGLNVVATADLLAWLTGKGAAGEGVAE